MSLNGVWFSGSGVLDRLYNFTISVLNSVSFAAKAFKEGLRGVFFVIRY